MSRPPREPDLESGFSSPTIVDSRRLMGPNLLHAGLGAVLDVTLDDSTPDHNATLLTAWHERVAAITSALGWPDSETTERVYAGGASLFVTAPIDQLMTATEVTELAWVFAEAVASAVPHADADLTRTLAFAVNEARIDADGHRRFAELWDEAQRLGLNVTFDETRVFVGSGAGATGWPLDAIPRIDHIDWRAVRDIPIVLVTGSNGKTTVVRMVAAMARAAGHTVGYTCTDGVWIGSEQVESGDYSGPAGARRVLQDPTVTLAVLETARGGMLRRGLALQHAAVAAIVTLSADHFGDYGITDLATLADAKMIVSRAVEATGTLIYNRDIPALVNAVSSYSGRALSVSLSDLNSARTEPRNHGDGQQQAEIEGTAVSKQSSTSPRIRGSVRAEFGRDALMSADELSAIPATLHGTATHNILNALVALAIADALDLGPNALNALRTFGADPRDNMGRLMVYTLGGVTIVIDYAHNPQSVAALIAATRAIPAARRAIALGTGGDRDDHALREIARAAFDSGVIDLYIAKEMPKFLRGREPGSISGAFLAALRTLGVDESQLVNAADDMVAARAALQWAQAGDVILLTVHDQRDAVLALLAELARNAWHAGHPLTA